MLIHTTNDLGHGHDVRLLGALVLGALHKQKPFTSRKASRAVSRLLLRDALARLSLCLSLCRSHPTAFMQLRVGTVIVLHQWLSFEFVTVSVMGGREMSNRRKDDPVNPEALRLRQDAADGDWMHLHIWAAAAGGSSQCLLLP